jgi:hypothetical protein
MKHTFLAFLVTILTACNQQGMSQYKIPVGNPKAPASGEAVATFA